MISWHLTETLYALLCARLAVYVSTCSCTMMNEQQAVRRVLLLILLSMTANAMQCSYSTVVWTRLDITVMCFSASLQLNGAHSVVAIEVSSVDSSF
jgi:hypothetical protein